MRAQVLFQMQRAPVGQGPFSVRRAQGDHAEERDDPAGPGRQPLLRLARADGVDRGRGRTVTQQGGSGEGGDEQADPGQQEEMGGGGEASATSPPSPAPTMPPRLNAAWKLGITGLRRVATRSTAALFIATFMPPYAAPNTSSTRPSESAEWVWAGRAMLRGSRTPQATVTAWLP